MNRPIYHSRDEARRGPVQKSERKAPIKFEGRELRRLSADAIEAEKLRAKAIIQSLLSKLDG